MISLLGDYSYTFPRPIPLKLKLKDLLEDNVDEKYYLSDKQINDIQSWNAYEKPLENMEKTDKSNISPTLTTRSGAYAAGMILVKNKTRIRKITCKEAFRLMGVKDEDYDNVCKNQSDSSLYHLAGDSIVVNVLTAIFKELL